MKANDFRANLLHTAVLEQGMKIWEKDVSFIAQCQLMGMSPRDLQHQENIRLMMDWHAKAIQRMKTADLFVVDGLVSLLKTSESPKYFLPRYGQKKETSREVGCIASPYKHTWIEMKIPKNIQLFSKSNLFLDKIGCLVDCYETGTIKPEEIIPEFFMDNLYIDSESTGWKIPMGKWTCSMCLFAQSYTGIVYPLGFFLYYVDEDGYLVKMVLDEHGECISYCILWTWRDSLACCGIVFQIMEGMPITEVESWWKDLRKDLQKLEVDSVFYNPKEAMTYTQQEILDYLPSVVTSLIRPYISGMSCLALSFLNCNNVVERVIEPPNTINKKRIKAGRMPHSAYKILSISPKSRKRQVVSETTVITGEIPLHQCRGHFKIYKKDEDGKGGLFGKYEGRWWWDHSLRGNPDMGAIDKDYNIPV